LLPSWGIEMQRLPLFKAWCHRSPYSFERIWEIGCFLAPWPKCEQEVGRLLRALLMVNVKVGLSPPYLLVTMFSDDPAERKPLPAPPDTT